VPFIPLYRLRKDGQHFTAMGRALSHMVQLTKSVPCVLARSVYVQLAFGTPPEDNCLLQDLMSFVTSQECALLHKAMTNFTACSQSLQSSSHGKQEQSFPHFLSSVFTPCMQTDKYTVTIHSAVQHR